MTSQTFILPYRRSSPVHVPRRDLVLAGTDSLALRVSIVESDHHAAQALELTGGIGGPALRVIVWRDGPQTAWDYGGVGTYTPEVLWTGTGTISDEIGSFDVAIPQGTLVDFPRRCGFAIFLDWDGGLESEMLAQGALHVRHVSGTPALTAEVITTDTPPLDPITTD